MTIQRLRLYGDPVPRTAGEPVTRFDDKISRLAGLGEINQRH